MDETARTPQAPRREPSAASCDELILALRAGEDRAAETLVRTHAPWMLSVVRRILHDKGLAEDCVQEAFINAFRNIDGFEGRSSLKSWLHRIVVNQALMKLRTRQRQRESPIDDLLPAFDENACRIEEPWQPPSAPDEILAQKDRRALIRAKIDQLPESYRIVLQLRDIEEMTTQDVAEALGLTEANVKVRLHRARSALKKLLEPVLTGDL
jgi:RNA polymerase sigma-70 factor (ECF subfamily)